MYKLPNRLTTQAVKICKDGDAEARRMSHARCGAGHLFIAGCQQYSLKPVIILRDQGFNIGEARLAVRWTFPVAKSRQELEELKYTVDYTDTIKQAVMLADRRSRGSMVNIADLFGGMLLSGSPEITKMVDRTGKSIPTLLRALGHDYTVAGRGR